MAKTIVSQVKEEFKKKAHDHYQAQVKSLEEQLQAQLKMLDNMDENLFLEALRSVAKENKDFLKKDTLKRKIIRAIRQSTPNFTPLDIQNILLSWGQQVTLATISTNLSRLAKAKLIAIVTEGGPKKLAIYKKDKIYETDKE